MSQWHCGLALTRGKRGWRCSMTVAARWMRRPISFPAHVEQNASVHQAIGPSGAGTAHSTLRVCC
ncbi:hypothetical protein, partial [Xanthomonas citri]|uniref:hypothetical protein n=2 Tax=Xanthomonas TaxID=338 RepID=UPI0019D6B4CC